MAEHARLGPSSARRWMVCPGSIRMIAAAPREESGAAAKLGTAAHELFEVCMRTDDDPQAWLGRTVAAHEVDEDMSDAVGHACDYVRSYMTTNPGAVWHAERRVNPGKLFQRKDLWGTADTTISNRLKRQLVVIDYKHGWIFVDAEDNVQLMTYALGALAEEPECGTAAQMPYDEVVLVIIQPRSYGQPVREHVIKMQELIDFALKLEKAAAATDDPWAPLVAGDHCKFCPASAGCAENRRHVLSVVCQQEFTDLDKPELTLLPMPQQTEELAYAMRQIPVIEAWVNAVKQSAYESLLRGFKLPGLKLVRGRNSRRWKNEALVRGTLLADGFQEDDFAPREMLSVAKTEALYKSKKMGKRFKVVAADVVNKIPGAVQMAREEDPREAVNPLSGDFRNLDEEEDLLS